MKNNKIHRIILLVILPVGLLFFIFSQWQANSTTNQQNSNSFNEKQKGAHVFGKLDSNSFQSLTQHNLEWITLVAWADQEDYDSPIVRHHKGDSSRMRNRDSNWVSQIKLARSAGFKVFAKPHIWIHSPSDDKWRSDIFPKNEANWKLWKESYRDFILRYAKLAEQANAEMFCIGMELTRLSVEKPEFWRKLAQDVRNVYSGKITYAANWYNEYEKVTFWDDLDYIGIQAYFPLVDNENPSIQQVSKGWNKPLSAMKSIHKKYNRKILFTEIGYKSTSDSAIKPWEWSTSTSGQKKILSFETQANCYQAFFDTVWGKKWFAGVHIWFMRSDFVEGTYKNDIDFIIHGKPAEDIIVKGFE